MGFKIRLLVFFSTIFSLSIPELTAYAMPEQFKGKLDTFIKNPNLSYGSNIFINALPLVGAHAKEKLPLKKQSDLVAVGRQAYEELGNIFAQTKIALDIENFKIPGNHNKGINLRLYKGNKNDKVILYIHGGGWRQGSLDTHDALCREISHRTEYSLIAVDYRLSPENPFPAGLNDVEETYEWVLNHYSEAKVLLCGDSAGGNLATALAIKRLQEHKKGPDGLLLLYPALDLRVPEMTDDPMADGYFLTRARITDYVKTYLGKDFKKLAEDATVSPLLASDDILKMLPPTLLIAAEYDPLTASSKEFVERAQNAGATIDLKVIEKTIHVFIQYPELFREANEALELLANKAKDF